MPRARHNITTAQPRLLRTVLAAAQREEAEPVAADDVAPRRAVPPSHDPRQRPSVAGVAGGVGTTTLAAAINGIDRGVFVGRRVDVLVCRGTVESLQRAGRAAHLQTDTSGHRPLLAVTATDPRGLSRHVSAQLRLTSAYASHVVTVPMVRRWQESTSYLNDARLMLTGRPAELPRPLRSYAFAVRDIRRHLGSPTASDRAYRSRGPAPARTTERAR